MCVHLMVFFFSFLFSFPEKKNGKYFAKYYTSLWNYFNVCAAFYDKRQLRSLTSNFGVHSRISPNVSKLSTVPSHHRVCICMSWEHKGVYRIVHQPLYAVLCFRAHIPNIFRVSPLYRAKYAWIPNYVYLHTYA